MKVSNCCEAPVTIEGRTTHFHKCSKCQEACDVHTATPNQELVHLYAEMAELTAPECAKGCPVPYACCEPFHCEQTIKWAAERWKVKLERTNGKSIRGEILPLMGPKGCTAAPHLRPICTVHTCEMNKFGCKKDDPVWTKKYFKLHERIDKLDFTEQLWKHDRGLKHESNT